MFSIYDQWKQQTVRNVREISVDWSPGSEADSSQIVARRLSGVRCGLMASWGIGNIGLWVVWCINFTWAWCHDAISQHLQLVTTWLGAPGGGLAWRFMTTTRSLVVTTIRQVPKCLFRACTMNIVMSSTSKWNVCTFCICKNTDHRDRLVMLNDYNWYKIWHNTQK